MRNFQCLKGLFWQWIWQDPKFSLIIRITFTFLKITRSIIFEAYKNNLSVSVLVSSLYKRRQRIEKSINISVIPNAPQGKIGTAPPPAKWETVIEKWLYHRNLYFRSVFYKKYKSSYSIAFSAKISPIGFLIQTCRENLAHGFLNLLKDRLKKWIFPIFLRNFCYGTGPVPREATQKVKVNWFSREVLPGQLWIGDVAWNCRTERREFGV